MNRVGEPRQGLIGPVQQVNIVQQEDMPFPQVTQALLQKDHVPVGQSQGEPQAVGDFLRQEMKKGGLAVSGSSSNDDDAMS